MKVQAGPPRPAREDNLVLKKRKKQDSDDDDDVGIQSNHHIMNSFEIEIIEIYPDPR